MGKLTYKELVSKEIKDNRNVVISKAYDKDNNFIGYSVTEQLVMQEKDGRETAVFLKNGLGILSRDGLINLRDAVNETLKECPKNSL